MSYSSLPLPSTLHSLLISFFTCRVFDRDGNGFITRDELQTAMEMIGEPLNEQQLEQLLAIADLDQDGRINYEGKLHTTTTTRTSLTHASPFPRLVQG